MVSRPPDLGLCIFFYTHARRGHALTNTRMGARCCWDCVGGSRTPAASCCLVQPSVVAAATVSGGVGVSGWCWCLGDPSAPDGCLFTYLSLLYSVLLLISIVVFVTIVHSYVHLLQFLSDGDVNVICFCCSSFFVPVSSPCSSLYSVFTPPLLLPPSWSGNPVCTGRCNNTCPV